MNTLDWKNATPEQSLLYNYAKSQLAFNTITPLTFIGAIGGSEFLTYDAAKLYLALEFSLFSINSTSMTPSAIIYNIANNQIGNLGAVFPYWNATLAAVNYFYSAYDTRNIVFSKIGVNGYQSMKFIGYRLNIV